LDEGFVVRIERSGPIETALVEQEQLGLCAGEIGGLLMQVWEVPSGLIQDVRDIYKIMVTPCKAPVDSRSARLALCYLCIRMGMMIARGELVDSRSLDVAKSESAEHFFLRDYLKHSSLMRLSEFLQFPEVVSCVDRMAATTRLRNQATSRAINF
jgi:hypothetical protein